MRALTIKHLVINAYPALESRLMCWTLLIQFYQQTIFRGLLSMFKQFGYVFSDGCLLMNSLMIYALLVLLKVSLSVFSIGNTLAMFFYSRELILKNLTYWVRHQV